MRMNNWIKYSLSLGLVALIGACSVATSMDATLEREVEATTELKEKAKEPSTPAPADVSGLKMKSGSATRALSNTKALRFRRISKPKKALP